MNLDDVSMPWSRLMSALTLVYGLYALFKPRHLGRQMEAAAHEIKVYDQVALTYAGRDLPVSVLGLASADPDLVTAAMGLRIFGDLSDALVLSTAAPNPQVRTKMLSATLGWAALNTVALLADRRRLDA